MRNNSQGYEYVGVDSNIQDYLASRVLKARRILEVLRLYTNLQNKKVCLDFGCNDGTMTNVFSEKFERTIGLDVDDNMIEQAKKEHEIKGLSFMRNDTEIPLPDDSVDVIIANHVLYYVEEKEPIVREFNRVLKNQGVCYISVTSFSFNRMLYFLPRKVRRIIESKLLGSTKDRGMPLSYAEYMDLFSLFDVQFVTPHLIKKYHVFEQENGGNFIRNNIIGLLSRCPKSVLTPLLKTFSSVYIFILTKKGNERLG